MVRVRHALTRCRTWARSRVRTCPYVRWKEQLTIRFGSRTARLWSVAGLMVLISSVVFWSQINQFLGIGSASASTYRFQTGYYIGNGGSKTISGLGFTPEVVIIKADDASGVGALMKTTAMPQVNSAYLGAATANDTTGAITLTSDGFVVAGANGNTANARFTWIAFSGSDCSASGQMCVGSYTGNGVATQAISSIGFQPDLVMVKAATAVAPVWRSSSMPNNYGQYFTATAQDTAGALFTTLNASGFTVGTTINTNLAVFYYVAFKNTSNAIQVGSYTGNATDNTNISTVGFVPDFVFVKNANTAVSAVYSVDESYGDATSYFTDTAVLVDSIQALQTNGFQVGTNSTANGNTNTMYYAAFAGAADHTATGTFKMVSGTYTGTGATRSFAGLGFSPDLVIIKASTTQAGVFRTKMMAGDSTAYIDSATANLTAAITSINVDGFTIGTAPQVNSSGVTYYYTAYGNAWNPDTNTGAADFTIGAYYVPATAIDSRNITRLPFQPDLVSIKRSGATGGVWRTSEHSGDLSSYYAATAEAANIIQTLNTDGFQIGTAANVATVSNYYWYFAFATGTNFAVGTYTGTGAAHSETTPFQPDSLWVKRNGATRGIFRTSDMVGSTSAPFLNVAPIANAITGLLSPGFQVGTAAEVNTSPNTYRWAGWRATTLDQSHFHVRRDDNTEALASSQTGGVQDATTTARENVPVRLRLAVVNRAATTTTVSGLQIEYATKTTSCAQATVWERVSAVGGAWDMYDSSNMTDGSDTTNIAEGIGGVTDENETFLTPNGGVRDTSDQTGALTLLATNFVEVEYSVMASSSAELDATYCFRLTDSGTSLPTYTVYPELTYVEHLRATAQGAQTSFIDVPATGAYIGGAFVVYDQQPNDTHVITSLTLSETGTVDASSSLKNITLFYKYDTTAPYDCASESYTGSETRFGSVDADGFSGPNGTSTFTGSVVASSTQAVCFYPVFDVQEYATSGETIELSIATTSEDVRAAGGDIVHGIDPIELSGTTVLRDDELTEVHYHWRNDDGSESGATSATGGAEDTTYLNMPRNSAKRLRVEVSNEGATSSPSTQYRLEYGERAGTCAAVSSWTDVGDAGGAFDMLDTANLTDGGDTTDIGVGTGGVTNEHTTFRTPNGAVRDTSSQTAGIVLTETQFVELEYAVQATASALDATTYCFRVTDAGAPLVVYSTYPEATITAAGNVSSSGTQAATLPGPGTDQYVGGVFVLKDQSTPRNVTGITIAETGTVNAQTDLSAVRLYYDLDTTAPYDCASESYAGSETQFGTPAASFTGPNGTASFSGSVGIATSTTMCVYVVLDIDITAHLDDTIEVEITDPSSQVTLSSGLVTPDSAVSISGATLVDKQQVVQTHYHFRNDDGSEAGATSMTGGQEDTPVANVFKSSTIRLRLEASKGGSGTTAPTVFGLQYAEKVSTCDAVPSWTPIETPAGAWRMSDSLTVTDGAHTTNISVASGGVTDANTSFLTPNGGVRDVSATTSPLTLTSSNFLELEYAVEPTAAASYGGTYCFRLVADGNPLDIYDVYPQATVQQNRDFSIQRGYTTIENGSSTVSLVAGADYTAPRASTSAFIRITSAAYTGAGTDSGGGTQNASDVTANIMNPSDILSGVTFVRAGTTNTTRIYWEIVEYIGPPGGDNEIRVRTQSTLAFAADALTATTSSVTGVVDDADIVVFITGQYNPDTSAANYHAGVSTAAWNTGDDTATFTRGVSNGIAAAVSYAIVEFNGVNWRIQRSEHTYTVAGVDETETLSTLNDVSRAFLHAQKRVAVNQVDEFGHEVWISSAGQITYRIPSTAASPDGHTSVAWVIENTQITGSPMVVTRSNGTHTAGGANPSSYPINIGATLSALTNGSMFMTMSASGDTTAFPRPITGAMITSTSQYTLWVSDTGADRSYRTEIVDWPTAVLTVAQHYYRWYADNDALTPTDAWPAGGTNLGENTTITAYDDPIVTDDVVRLRVALAVRGSNLAAGGKSYKLQYGVRSTTCGAIGTWHTVGDSASTTASWRAHAGTPLDGQPLSTNPPTGGDLVLSVSDRAGSYEEDGPTTGNPFKVFLGDAVEYDWSLEAHAVVDRTVYCFRMVESDGTALSDYEYYPTLTTAGFMVVGLDWRWFDDADAVNPSVPLNATNTAPINIDVGNVIKLRMNLEEIAGKTGSDVKFKLQYSEFSDFSVVHDVVDTDSCTVGSLWCYADGAGMEGATVTEQVLFGADACSGGVGAGCGVHTEFSYTPEAVGEVGTTTANNVGTTIVLSHTYTDPVYIVEAITGDTAGGGTNRPAAAVITATTSTSFTVRIQEPDDEADNHGYETVAYLVMERGAYTLPDGRRVDVGTKTTTNYYGNAVSGASDDTCSFTQTFTHAPVVLTSLQTNNNVGAPDFLTASQVSVTTNDFSCAMEVPDGVATEPTQAETIGWIAIESGSFGNGGIDLLATSTSLSVTGWEDLPWYEYVWPFEYFASVPGLVASKQSRFGADGGWVRYGSVGTSSVYLAMDEADGGNRSHTDEQVGILAFSQPGMLYRAGASGASFGAYARKEYEFTIIQHDAHVGRTYFFRAYNVGSDEPVEAATVPGMYPSLLTASGAITSDVGGFATGSSTEGVTSDVTTTATAIPFGSLALGADKHAVQRLMISTNASNGYQVFVYEHQPLTSDGGASIEDIAGTNIAPVSWATGCSGGAMSCFGYHSSDNTLAGGSTRFLLDDTYAALTGTLAEVAFSSGPVTNESTDIVYRIRANALQPAGRYENKIEYIIVPVF